jgi:hypothetical protein
MNQRRRGSTSTAQGHTLEPEAAAKLQAFYQANTTVLAEILDAAREDESLHI